MSDRFKSYSAGLESPASDGFAVTPHDSTELTELTRAIYVGTAGDVVVGMGTGGDLLFKNVAGGTLLPVRAQYVRASGTTASDILGLV